MREWFWDDKDSVTLFVAGTSMKALFCLHPEGIAHMGIMKCGRISGEMSLFKAGEIIPGYVSALEYSLTLTWGMKTE
jgi:hypothetical protein